MDVRLPSAAECARRRRASAPTPKRRPLLRRDLSGTARPAGDGPAAARPLAFSMPSPSIAGEQPPAGPEAARALPEWWTALPSAVRSLVGGGIAGSVSKTVIAPLDRTKILFQVSHRPFSFPAARLELMRIVRQEGSRALWKGNTATVARVFPYAGIQFMSFEQFKGMYLQQAGRPCDDRLRPLERLGLGASAGAVSVAITYPLDLMRARLAVQIHDKTYRSLTHGLRTLSAHEGVRGMYRGAAPTLLGILPYAGLSWMTFGVLKQAAEDHLGHPVPAPVALACGAVAGLLAQSATYPLDLVRRRMQTEDFMRGSKDVPPLRSYGSIAGTLVGIVRHEGVSALFKGVTMNWVKGPIAVGTSFAVYEYLKRRILVVDPHTDEAPSSRRCAVSPPADQGAAAAT